MTDREKLVDALQEDAARLTGYMNAEPSGAHTVRLGMMTVGAILERILAAADLLSQEGEREVDGYAVEWSEPLSWSAPRWTKEQAERLVAIDLADCTTGRIRPHHAGEPETVRAALTDPEPAPERETPHVSPTQESPE